MKNTDKFKIKVVNSQTIDGETESVAEDGIGSIREKNGVFYIVYKTNSATVMLKTDGTYVELKRTGDSQYTMNYAAGKSSSCGYNTPYGTINMNVFTKSIKCELTEDGGELAINYILETNGDKLYNDISISVEKRKG